MPFQDVLQLSTKIAPKVVLVSMFQPEEEVWTSRIDFVHNVTVLGLSPVYPSFRCTDNYDVCQFTTGEGEINAAVSVASLVVSPIFDFSKTYWLLGGIGGGIPSQVTTGSITFAKYAIQAGLQNQIDSSEIALTHPNWTSGYFPFRTRDPWSYPNSVYGTEVFELNENLRDRALRLAKGAGMALSIGDDENINLRKMYDGPGAGEPQLVACDVLTSDGYFTGLVLNDYYSNYTSMITNGTGIYCSTAQEDNASLEAFIRVARANLVDFKRIVIIRTISNFAQAPPCLSHDPISFFLDYPKGSIDLALDNLYAGGWPFVADVIEKWEELYEGGVNSTNYVGDILGTLGGTRDFGKDEYTIS